MIIITFNRLIEIGGDNISANSQFLEWDGRIISDLDKRFAVKEFVNTFNGFPERSMMTNEYMWPLRPEPARDVRIESSSRAPESDVESLEEQGSQKRCAPWGVAEVANIKRHCKLSKRSASGERMLDSECAVAAKVPGMC